jgi:hypothetical protein
VVRSGLPFFPDFFWANWRLGGELQSGKNDRKKRQNQAFPEWELRLLAGGLKENSDDGAVGKICQSGSLKVSYWEN